VEVGDELAHVALADALGVGIGRLDAVELIHHTGQHPGVGIMNRASFMWWV
jgi:hypothetical protein